MKKTAFISDLIFTFILTSVFFLCLFRYLGSNVALALLFAVLCGSVATLGVGAFGVNKRRKFFLKRSDVAQKSKLLTHLSLLSSARQSTFLQNLLSQTDAIKRISAYRLVGEEKYYFLKIHFSPVTADEIADISHVKTAKEKILLCDTINEDAKNLCNNLDIRVFDGEKVYALAKEANALPEAYLGEPSPQNKRKIRLRLCFSKNNSRRFLVGGCLLLLTSLITPFPYYYLIFGSVLLLFAIFIRIFGYTA